MTCIRHVMEAADILESPSVSGAAVVKKLKEYGVENITVRHLTGNKGETDFIKVIIPGEKGKVSGGEARTLGIIGRLGGVGARPSLIGMVSDADGAIVALAVAMKLGEMRNRGDTLPGDVIITTHVTPRAPTRPHKPVPFMDSPVEITELLKLEVDPQMDAILSVDATKANRVIKVQGFAITPTVKDGWLLKVSDDLISVYERVVGDVAHVVPITMQDITPFDSNVYHINSMMLPWLMTSAPVVGVALTAKLPIAGCSTGANYIYSLEQATRFCVEVAKEFTSGQCSFFDEEEYKKLVNLYGDMGSKLRGSGSDRSR